ncbi:MAG: sigma-70 family RNA polymerase sigma factor [Planctomycetota bacterium]
MTEFPETRASLLAQIQCPENREAWEVFAATYQPVIYRMARRRGMQDADAHDLVQNVLIRVSNAIERYERQSDVRFRNWLGRVASNAILSGLARSPRDQATGGTDAGDQLVQHPDSAALTQELNLELKREQFLRAAASVRADVSHATWTAFELTVIQGRSNEEAAEELGKSIGTIYAARSRVFKRLRDHIERMAGECP